MAGESVSGRVLVVDDELHVRDLLRDVLTTMGDEVVTVATGAEALEVVPTFQPDVILVDMVMPGLSGTDVLDALRRNRCHRASDPHLGVSNDCARRVLRCPQKAFRSTEAGRDRDAAIAQGESNVPDVSVAATSPPLSAARISEKACKLRGSPRDAS